MNVKVFDIESTGLSTRNDRIVSLTILDGQSGLLCLNTLVNPTIPIPKEASQIHGITNESVANSPTFKELAPIVQGMIDGAVLAGYNIKRFDVPMLHAELTRAGCAGINLSSVQELDAYHLWNVLEPRNLSTAVKQFAPHLVGFSAHDSKADTVASWAVTQGLMQKHGLDLQDAINLCKSVDRYNRFSMSKEVPGLLLWNFGKHKGKPVVSHLDYAAWLIKQDFCEDETRNLLLIILEENNHGRA